MPRPRPDKTKYCPDCKQIKSVDEFYKGASYEKRSGGYSPYCKVCSRIRNNKRWIDNPDKMREDARRYFEKYNNEERKQKAILRSSEYLKQKKAENPARFRAKRFFDTKRENVAPDITIDFLEELFRNTSRCQCCGKKLCLEYKERNTRQYRSNPDVPSIDRVNNHKGYTRSNIAIICWECNYRKTDLSLEDLEMMVAYIRKYGDFENV